MPLSFKHLRPKNLSLPKLKKQIKKINDDYIYIFFVHTPWDNAFAENVRGVCDRTAPSGEKLLCVTNGRNWFDSIYFEQ